MIDLLTSTQESAPNLMQLLDMLSRAADLSSNAATHAGQVVDSAKLQIALKLRTIHPSESHASARTLDSHRTLIDSLYFAPSYKTITRLNKVEPIENTVVRVFPSEFKWIAAKVTYLGKRAATSVIDEIQMSD